MPDWMVNNQFENKLNRCNFYHQTKEQLMSICRLMIVIFSTFCLVFRWGIAFGKTADLLMAVK